MKTLTTLLLLMLFSACTEKFNSNQKESTECEKIHHHKMGTYPESGDVMLPVQDMCFYRRAVATSNISDCAHAGHARRYCYGHFAAIKKDIAICGALDGERLKMSDIDQNQRQGCIYEYVKATKDTTACNRLWGDKEACTKGPW